MALVPVQVHEIIMVNTVMAFQKRGSGAKKVKGRHYLEFQGIAISKKRYCHKRNHFLLYKTK